VKGLGEWFVDSRLCKGEWLEGGMGKEWVNMC